jgi:hypothetical protein
MILSGILPRLPRSPGAAPGWIGAAGDALRPRARMGMRKTSSGRSRAAPNPLQWVSPALAPNSFGAALGAASYTGECPTKSFIRCGLGRREPGGCQKS